MPAPGCSWPAPRCGLVLPLCCALQRKRCGEAGLTTRTFLRHARRLRAGAWAGGMAELGRSRADREAPPPPARYDPLIHPIAITERCVIGDQIRVPAARCDMAGCGSGFADPAALGEAHIRASALAAGWGQDAFGRLVCPPCRQRYRVAPAPPELRWQPDSAAEHPTADGAAGPGGGMRPSVRSIAAGWYRPLNGGRHRRIRWPLLLSAPASAPGGRTAPLRVAVPSTGKGPEQAAVPTVGRRAARHTRGHRPAPPPRLSPGGRAPSHVPLDTACLPDGTGQQPERRVTARGQAPVFVPPARVVAPRNAQRAAPAACGAPPARPDSNGNQVAGVAASPDISPFLRG
jgi:hypothetical protein